MKNKLDTILLIDDDKATNFFHKIIIEDSGIATKVLEKENALAALDYLQHPRNGQYPQPDLILLDINMPQYTGWDFLEEYKQLNHDQKGKVVIVMLSTSINPDDHEKAKHIPEIAEFRRKPLTQQVLQEIVTTYF